MGDDHKNMGLGSLEESVNRLINKMHDIKAVGIKIEFEERRTFRRLISDTTETIDNAKDCLLDSVMNQLSPKQVEFLIRDTTPTLGMILFDIGNRENVNLNDSCVIRSDR